jgi:hypothetical protein
LRPLLASLAAAALLSGAAAAEAHEFWLQPDRFQVAPRATSPAVLMVGIGEDRERWGVGPAKVARLEVRGPEGVRDARAALRAPGGPADALLSYAAPGLHVVAFESRPALSVLPAGRFDDYLADSGLAAAIAARAGANGRPGRERYSRRAKALVQVGAATARDDTAATAPAGLTLEIVPEKNPYRLAPGEALPVRVLYQGRPLAGALVKLFCLDLDHQALARRATDAAGRARFVVPARGAWMLSVIWSRPVATRDADFETVFSSLTFGYP